MAARPAVDPRRIGLVGVSLGAFLSLAVGTEEAPGGVNIKTIVDVSGGLAPPWDGLATAAFPPTLILHGEIDPMVPPSNARTLDEILTRLGVRHELHLFPHEGHWFSMAAQAEILRLIAGFLDSHL